MLTILGLIFLTVMLVVVPLILVWITLKIFSNVKTSNMANCEYIPKSQLKERFPNGLPVIYTWPSAEMLCYNCGKYSYFSLITIDKENIPPDMLEELQDGTDTGNGRILLMPNVVICQHCKTRYFADYDDNPPTSSEGNSCPN